MSARPLKICAVGAARSTHVASRTRCFAELGHQVYLVTETPSGAGIPGVTELVPQPGCGFTGVLLRAVARPFGVAGHHALRALAFAAILHRVKPDIVHVHFAYSYYGWLAGILGCRPLAVTVMGGDILFEEQGAPTPAGKFLTLHLLQQADYITSKSDYLISVLDRLGGFGRKAERIVWGVSLNEFHRLDASGLRARLGIAPDRRIVLSPKILQPFYRVHLVVEAMAAVVREVPQALLLVTEYSADGAYRLAIEKRIAELGLQDHVMFCGHVLHDDMPHFYNLAEMTVAVPSSDGLPQTLLEGMACEVPSILGKLPRYREIVTHRESAFFVDDDPQSIAEGIIELCNAPHLRATIARNALAIVRAQGNLEEQAARVEAKFRELARATKLRVWRPSSAWRAWRDYRRYAAARKLDDGEKVVD